MGWRIPSTGGDGRTIMYSAASHPKCGTGAPGPRLSASGLAWLPGVAGPNRGWKTRHCPNPAYPLLIPLRGRSDYVATFRVIDAAPELAPLFLAAVGRPQFHRHLAFRAYRRLCG